MIIEAGKLNRQVTIQRRSETRDPVYNTSVVTWVDHDTVWADVQDMLPSRAERIAEGIDLSRRPARVRMRYRTDVDTTMRFVVDGRTLRIIAGPAELGRRQGVEFTAEEISTGGQEP